MPESSEIPFPEKETTTVLRREVFPATLTERQRDQLAEIRGAAGALAATWTEEDDKWVLTTTWEAFT